MTPTDGACLCGATLFRINDPLFTHACHCLNCQKRTGGAFSIATFVLASDLELLTGEVIFEARQYNSSFEGAACTVCGTELWYPVGAGLTIVRSAGLADVQAVKPLAHIWVRRKRSWVTLDDDTPQCQEGYDMGSAWPRASLDRLPPEWAG